MKNLYKYLRQTVTGQQWQCLLCFRRSTSIYFAKMHLKSHYSCDRCGRNFAGAAAKYHFNRHQQSCKGPRNGTCQFCGTLKPMGKLVEHLKTCRKNPTKYDCNYCGLQFKTKIMDHIGDWKKHTAICAQNPDNIAGTTTFKKPESYVVPKVKEEILGP
jgi:transcription elongation factor Elf1